MSANFISQNSLATLPKLAPIEAEGRVIMTDFTVFHDVSNNSGHFAEPETGEDDRQDYLEGFEAGKAESAGVYEATIKVMEQTLEQLKSTLDTQVKEIEASHARVIVQCLEAVLPETAKRVLINEMTAVLKTASGSVVDGRLIAHIHPENTVAKEFLSARDADAFEIRDSLDCNITEVSFTWGKSHVTLTPIEAAQTCLSLLNEAIGVPSSSIPQLQNEVIS